MTTSSIRDRLTALLQQYPQAPGNTLGITIASLLVCGVIAMFEGMAGYDHLPAVLALAPSLLCGVGATWLASFAVITSIRDIGTYGKVLSGKRLEVIGFFVSVSILILAGALAYMIFLDGGLRAMLIEQGMDLKTAFHTQERGELHEYISRSLYGGMTIIVGGVMLILMQAIRTQTSRHPVRA